MIDQQARAYYPGMGQAVADRTINRPGENWEAVASRVALGNSMLDPEFCDRSLLEDHLRRATILMSGRHLQHGDASQPGRVQEVFTNCSTAMTRATAFYLLLNGSGVGTSYDDDIMTVDWRFMPEVQCVLSVGHPDNHFALVSPWLTRELAETAARLAGRRIITFRVPDSREGWAQAVETLEELTWTRKHKDAVLILDFSDVRCKGSPIKGMQNRPSSGPIPLMQSITRVGLVKHQDWKPWRQAMQIDHELAVCVLVGGARRAARIAVKIWTDPDILEFIRVKREGDLWSSNNSIGTDQDFVDQVLTGAPIASEIFEVATREAYPDGTGRDIVGEPGFLRLDRLQVGERRPTKDEIMKVGHKFHIGSLAYQMRLELAARIQGKRYWMIVNPCGEIRLFLGGGYCVIADVVPYHCVDLRDFEKAVRAATRALIRTNLMTAFYRGEVERTNRIGVGLTGIFEYALSHYGFGFRDLIEADLTAMVEDANGQMFPAPTLRVCNFWYELRRIAEAVDDEARRYSKYLGVAAPSTGRTIKPAGTTSKLFGLTEGAHLPSRREYLRWVQFRSDDPLINDYEAKGYPVRRDLSSYPGTSIVGFPTRLEICNSGTPDQIVTAAEATPAEQLRWVRLLETFWLLKDGGNQISYTMKYDPGLVSLDQFRGVMLETIRTVRAMSVMPQIEMTGFEYQPEEPISRERYDELMAHIERTTEDLDKVHVDCAGGFCPIEFYK